MKIQNLPGIVFLLAIGFASNFISDLVVLGGKHPLEASVIAVLMGLFIRNVYGLSDRLLPGVQYSEKLLIWGVVLMGAGLDFKSFGTQGPHLLAVIVITMALGFPLILVMGKLFKLPKDLALLLAIGTTICGTSAIAVTAPLIKAKDEETSYAVATIAIWGLIAILLYPALGRLVGCTEIEFGAFAGTAIHSTPQVVGAGYIFSEIAGNTATAIKLIRNCFMAPLAILIAIWSARANKSSLANVNIAKAFPWFLFGYFLMATCNSWGYFTPAGSSAFSDSGKFLILLGMAGVGLCSSLQSIKSVGIKPLVVGCIGAIILAGVSIGAIMIFIPR